MLSDLELNFGVLFCSHLDLQVNLMMSFGYFCDHTERQQIPEFWYATRWWWWQTVSHKDKQSAILLLVMYENISLFRKQKESFISLLKDFSENIQQSSQIGLKFSYSTLSFLIDKNWISSGTYFFIPEEQKQFLKNSRIVS